MNNEDRFAIHAAASPTRVPPRYRVITAADAAAFWRELRGPKVELTRWKNPTRSVQRVTLSLFLPSHVSAPESERQVVVVWKPGQTVPLPSIYDRCIHVARDGHVVGGLAPALRCEGSFPVDAGLADESHEPYDGPEAA